MDSHQIWKLLAKYFADETTAQERLVVEEWINASDENRRLYTLFQRVWKQESGAGSIDNIDVSRVWQDTRRKLTEIQTFHKKADTNDRKSQPKAFIKYAAAAVFVLFALLTGILLFQLGINTDNETKVFKTKVGESARFNLQDGSAIVLAPGSSLKVAEGFNSSARKVFLEGEAFFEIEKDRSRPFWVHAGTSVTKVLGTQFNINAYPDNTFIEVVVVEGSVAVEKENTASNDQDTVLKKGDLARCDGQQDKVEVQHNMDSESHLKWMSGIIYLEDMPMAEVVKRLERWYPARFSFQTSELASKRLTAEFSSRQSLEEILEAITLALKMEYKRDQASVIFYKKIN